MNTRAIVSPGSARIVHVQSALLPYSKGKCGLEIIPLCPLSVPPQASSAANREGNLWRCAEMRKQWVRKKSPNAKHVASNLLFCSRVGWLVWILFVCHVQDKRKHTNSILSLSVVSLLCYFCGAWFVVLRSSADWYGSTVKFDGNNQTSSSVQSLASDQQKSEQIRSSRPNS